MSRRIAIVEDEAAIRENYADVLRKQGYEVQTYCNREEAMSAFDLRLPNLAIIDIGLESEIDGGFASSHFCEDAPEVQKVLGELKVTTRCIPLDQQQEPGTCIFSGKPSTGRAVFGKSY